MPMTTPELTAMPKIPTITAAGPFHRVAQLETQWATAATVQQKNIGAST
jgi:hypothetical protein